MPGKAGSLMMSVVQISGRKFRRSHTTPVTVSVCTSLTLADQVGDGADHGGVWALFRLSYGGSANNVPFAFYVARSLSYEDSFSQLAPSKAPSRRVWIAPVRPISSA
jgi:hypothetical protein